MVADPSLQRSVSPLGRLARAGSSTTLCCPLEGDFPYGNFPAEVCTDGSVASSPSRAWRFSTFLEEV